MLNWTNSPLRVFIYIQKAIPKEDNQIHAGINTLESDRHEIIACIARAKIGNNTNCRIVTCIKRQREILQNERNCAKVEQATVPK